jgi:hypothetical protein
MPAPEYGVPTGTLVLDGRVLDELGAPIPGMEVRFEGSMPDTTDADGNWEINQDHAYIPCAFGNGVTCTVVATDIDGPDNGGPYPPAPFLLSLVQTDPGSGGMDLGTWEQHGIDILIDPAVEYGPPPAKVLPLDKMPPAE